MKTVFALVLSIFAGAAFADEYWTEEVVVADGPAIVVNRSVEYACRGKTPWDAHRKYPCLYRLNFEHPRLTFVDIRWEGTKNIDPITLQVINDVPYLAIYTSSGASAIHDKPHLYGCPETPFSFLKYDLKTKVWSPIAPEEAPEALLTVNLVPRYWPYTMEKGKLDKNDVAKAISEQSHPPGSHFQSKIPRNGDEWNYRLKKADLTGRVAGDCRPPIEKMGDTIFPRRKDGELDLERIKPRVVEYEVIEDRRFDPPQAIPEGEDGNRWHDDATAKTCKSYFTATDEYDYRFKGLSGFVADTTGQRFTSNVLNNLYCSDAFNLGIWQIGNSDFIVLAKYNKAGEVLDYMKIPKSTKSLAVVPRQSRLEKGFFYFILSEWENHAKGIVFSRWMNVRIKMK